MLSNAIKFTEHGQIFIDVEWITCDAFSGTLQLTVRDTGIGIPQEEIKHIFDRFYRVNPSYQGKYKGTGLGLTITKKLIEYLNGSIAVKSQLNVGTEFICTFPFQFDRHNALPAHQQYGMIPQQCIPTKKMSILFVEDVPLIQRFSANMLETLGCDVTLASNGKEALQYSKNTYDLIFMDIGLPDEDGLAVIRKIRQQEKNRHRTPIIALTAHATETVKQGCLDAGADDFLAKPASFKEIITRLNKYTN